MGWWKKTVAGVEGREGKWIWERMEQVLGDEGKVSFWDGYWTGDRSLKDLFPRLFQLSNNKIGKVREMGLWENGNWRWELRWVGVEMETRTAGKRKRRGRRAKKCASEF